MGSGGRRPPRPPRTPLRPRRTNKPGSLLPPVPSEMHAGAKLVLSRANGSESRALCREIAALQGGGAGGPSSNGVAVVRGCRSLNGQNVEGCASASESDSVAVRSLATRRAMTHKPCQKRALGYLTPPPAARFPAP